MAISKNQKVEIVEKLNSIFTENSVLFLTTNNAKESVDSVKNYNYRSELNKSKVSVTIAKNTLINLALKNKGVELDNSFVGQTYVQSIAGGDEVGVIKATLDLIKKPDFENCFQVLGSLVNGEFVDAEKTKVLAKVPTFSQSMAMVAGCLNTTISKIAVGVKEVPASIARGVHAVSQKES